MHATRTTLASFTIMLALALPACGGGSEATRDPASTRDTAGTRDTAVEEDPEVAEQNRLRAQQDALCMRVCKKVYSCSIEYAKQNLTPAVVADMKAPEARKAAKKKCKAERKECAVKQPTQKAANKTGRCLREKGTCGGVMACLDG